MKVDKFCTYGHYPKHRFRVLLSVLPVLSISFEFTAIFGSTLLSVMLKNNYGMRRVLVF
jgi:hypothetical protein